MVSILNRLYPQFTDSMEKNYIGILDFSSKLGLTGYFIYIFTVYIIYFFTF
jgi:hypothetical protein